MFKLRTKIAPIQLSKFNSVKSKIVFIVIFAIALNIYIHRREIFNPYVVEPDIFSNYIIYLLDNSLFNNDLLSQYIRYNFPFSSNPIILICIIPSIYFFSRLFYLTNIFPLSQIIVVVLMICSVIATVFIYKIGSMFKEGRFAFYLVTLFLIYSSTMDSFSGGLPRGIGFILTCALYYYLCKEYIWKIALCMSLTIFFYPNILPMSVFAFILTIYKRVLKKNYKPKDILYSIIIFTFISWIVYLFFHLFENPLYEYLKNYMGWKFLLKIGPTDNIFKSFILNFVLNVHEHSIMYGYLTLFFLMANCLFLFFKSKKRLITQGEMIFVWSSVLSFIMILPFHAGIASRQLIFSIPLFLVILFWKQVISKTPWEGKTIAVFTVVILSVFVAFNRYSNVLHDFTPKKKSYDYLSLLPKDILIAGHPTDLEYIPFFSKRSVFFNNYVQENPWLFNEETNKIFEERKRELLHTMYYSSKLEGIIDFVIGNHITHLNVNEYYYSPQYLLSPVKWYEREKEEILNFISAQKDNGDEFVVLEVARRYGQYMGSGIYILDCRDIIGRKSDISSK